MLLSPEQHVSDIGCNVQLSICANVLPHLHVLVLLIQCSRVPWLARAT